MLREQNAKQQKELEQRVLALLPDSAPGLTTQVVHEQIATWSPSHIGHLLRRLERTEQVASALVQYDRPQHIVRRHFWRRLALP